MRIFFLAAVLIFTVAGSAQSGAAKRYTPEQLDDVSQAKPIIPEVDHIRLAETFRLGDEIGDRVWPKWRKAPFAVLLVTPDYEFLIRHPKPSADFAKLAYDPVLKSDVYYRKLTLSLGFLATFLAIIGRMVFTILVFEVV